MVVNWGFSGLGEINWIRIMEKCYEDWHRVESIHCSLRLQQYMRCCIKEICSWPTDHIRLMSNNKVATICWPSLFYIFALTGFSSNDLVGHLMEYFWNIFEEEKKSSPSHDYSSIVHFLCCDILLCDHFHEIFLILSHF